ncbi:hypothetical protein AB1Y20_014126 [Prymnesium parvum]|uniref:Cyclic nucleotide-binding domain-containing protein n=1 Tax=Prymnesium parvum TaxID=97485 RepID=A0AB34IIE8_PRYPA
MSAGLRRASSSKSAWRTVVDTMKPDSVDAKLDRMYRKQIEQQGADSRFREGLESQMAQLRAALHAVVGEMRELRLAQGGAAACGAVRSSSNDLTASFDADATSPSFSIGSPRSTSDGRRKTGRQWLSEHKSDRRGSSKSAEDEADDRASLFHCLGQRSTNTSSENSRDSSPARRDTARRKSLRSALSVLATSRLLRCAVLLPSHPFFFVWHKVILVCVAYVAVWAPLQTAFDEQLREPETVWLAVNLVVDSIFIADVALVFNVAFKKQGTWVLSRREIALKYLRGRFLLDVVAAFPYGMLTVGGAWDDDDGASSVLRALRLLRLMRVVRKLLQNGTEVAEVVSGYTSQFNPALVRVSQLVVMLVLACHWVGCLWWLVGTLPRTETHPLGDKWGPDAWLREQGLTTQYIHSFNWGAGMILAYVPREVYPQEPAEVVVTLISMFLGFFLGMIFISATTSALQYQDSKTALSQQKLEKIWRFLEYKKVNITLCRQILEYYKYLTTSSVTLSQMAEFKELPLSLQKNLMMELNRNVLQKCPLWSALPWEVVVKLMSQLLPMVFPPDHVIVEENQKSPGLHFIEQGTVQVLQRHRLPSLRAGRPESTDPLGDVVGVMGESEYFGESSILSILTQRYGEQHLHERFGRVRRDDKHFSALAAASIRTVSFCDILVLRNESFLQAIDRHEALQKSMAGVQEALERNKNELLTKRYSLSAASGEHSSPSIVWKCVIGVRRASSVDMSRLSLRRFSYGEVSALTLRARKSSPAQPCAQPRRKSEDLSSRRKPVAPSRRMST